MENSDCVVAESGVTDCKDCLCGSKIFNYLTEDELNSVDKNKFLVNYKAGEIIFKQGTRSTHSISFTHGFAKVFNQGVKEELIVRIIKPTELISGYGLLFNKTHHYSVSAITNSSACFIEADLLNDIFKKNEFFRTAFIAEVQGYNYFIQKRLIDLLNKKNPGRIAGTLLYFSREIFMSNDFPLILGNVELRKLCAVSADSLSRILNQFQEGEIIKIVGKEIKILNPDILERIWLNG